MIEGSGSRPRSEEERRSMELIAHLMGPSGLRVVKKSCRVDERADEEVVRGVELCFVGKGAAIPCKRANADTL